MRKTDKKRDNQLRQLLTNICETALKEIPGFQWLTHLVDYNDFPNSLRIVFVFDTQTSLERYQASENKTYLAHQVTNELRHIGIPFRAQEKHFVYDSEEACEQQHQGNWQKRLN